MDISILGEHLLISLVPWLVGVVVGGGLGYTCALGARGLFSVLPGLRGPSTLLPWRTVALTLLLLFPFIPVHIGLGTVAGAIMVALFVFAFDLPLTAITALEHWYPSLPVIRLIGGIRTLAVASVTVATLAPLIAGSGGGGAIIVQGWRSPNYLQVFRGFVVVVLLSLVTDLVLGTLQFLLSRTWNSSNRSRARMTNHATPMPPNYEQESMEGPDSIARVLR
jgi:ABC-type proline/glycine betaine transport system permease subunit